MALCIDTVGVLGFTDKVTAAAEGGIFTCHHSGYHATTHGLAYSCVRLLALEVSRPAQLPVMSVPKVL